MTRKRFRFFMIIFIIISISVLSGFMINNLQNRKKSSEPNGGGDQVQTEGVTGDYKDNGQTAETFSFYINENTVKKTKTTSNEVTTFNIELKLFITNNSSKTANIDPDAFSISYDTKGAGLLYSIEYGNIEKPVVLEGFETTAITFVVKYLIKDVESFNDHQKHSLKINYISEEILTSMV